MTLITPAPSGCTLTLQSGETVTLPGVNEPLGVLKFGDATFTPHDHRKYACGPETTSVFTVGVLERCDRTQVTHRQVLVIRRTFHHHTGDERVLFHMVDVDGSVTRYEAGGLNTLLRDAVFSPVTHLTLERQGLVLHYAHRLEGGAVVDGHLNLVNGQGYATVSTVGKTRAFLEALDLGAEQ